MKRSIFALVLALLLCVSLTGCVSDPMIDSGEPATASTGQSTTETTNETTVETTVEETSEETTEETTSQTTEATTAETVHTHSFSDATCTKPKTCSVCGETAGKAAGHDWDDATCKAPKTCSVCGKTSGSAAAHDYEDGECQWCGKTKSSSGSEMVWIPTKGGKKYHKKETCSNMDHPEKVTKEEAEDLGFDPCKKCYK